MPTLMSKATTYGEDIELLGHLRALYDQGHARSDLSKCIEQCERSLREQPGMGPFWRIKLSCLLAGACLHEAEVSIRSLEKPSR
jgi:hypothetical protein